MKTLNDYKAVFFDASDTLLTISEPRNIAHHYFTERNIPADLDGLESAMRDAIRKFYYEKETDASATCSPESDRKFWMDIYRHVLVRLGLDQSLNARRIDELCDELYDIFVDPRHYTLFDDVKEVLEELRNRGFRIGLVSNFALTLRALLEEKGILAYFDPIIVSTEVGLEKPNPAIFQLALERSGLKASEVLYVGDHPINDVWAPNQIGMDAIRIDRYAKPEGGVIRSLRELFMM